jgi:hypothetical protein
MLNPLTRLPEPVKRRLRGGFVGLVNAGMRAPGVLRATARVRRLLPGLYQWFAVRYKAYGAQPHDQTSEPVPGIDLTVPALQPNSFSTIQTEGLSADESACLARLQFAVNVRPKRNLW